MRVVAGVCWAMAVAACGAADPGPPPAAPGPPALVATRPATVPDRPIPAREASGAGLTLEDGTEYQIRMLETAKAQLQTFIEKAGDRPEFAEAVQRSRERVADIEQTICFLRGKQPC
jgi:hypothetical protein